MPLRAALSRPAEKQFGVASPKYGWHVAPVSFDAPEDLEFARLSIEDSDPDSFVLAPCTAGRKQFLRQRAARRVGARHG